MGKSLDISMDMKFITKHAQKTEEYHLQAKMADIGEDNFLSYLDLCHVNSAHYNLKTHLFCILPQAQVKLLFSIYDLFLLCEIRL